MIKHILSNIAEMYYPVDICAYKNHSQYIETKEFKNLSNKLDIAFSLSEYIFRNQFLDKLQSVSELASVRDLTLESTDRCLTFNIEFFEDDVLYQLTVNVSLLIPYYLIYVLKNSIQNEPYKWLTSPERDEAAELGKFRNHIQFISGILENDFLYNKLPKPLTDEVIPNINYADVEMGNFTYINAFFRDDLKL